MRTVQQEVYDALLNAHIDLESRHAQTLDVMAVLRAERDQYEQECAVLREQVGQRCMPTASVAKEGVSDGSG